MFTDRKGNLLNEDMLGEYVIDWQTKADFLNLSVGEEVTVRLPPGGSEELIWALVLTAVIARLEQRLSMQERSPSKREER